MFSQDHFTDALRRALKRGGDYADIFVERSQNSILAFDDRKVKSISSGTVSGIGLRVILGRRFYYLYASDPSEARLFELAEAMASAVGDARAAGGPSGNLGPLPGSPSEGRGSAIGIDPRTSPLSAKLELLARMDEAARSPEARALAAAGGEAELAQLSASYWEKLQEVWIATSEGNFVHENRSRLRLTANAVSRRGERRENGFASLGRTQGMECLGEGIPESLGREAARVAYVGLSAENAPSGKLPVVLEKGFGGVIFHEACGHALEATSVADDASVFSGKLGRRIAHPALSAVDDGTIPGEFGTAAFDDEGLPTRRTLLIDKGVLTSYLVDRLGQAKMGLPATGCSRRESYKFAPTSRMSNTFILPGPHSREELIAGVDKGIYCARMGGGSVNTATTEFNFAVREAYLIEGGRLGRPLKGVSLIGKGEDILMGIEAVAGDLDHGGPGMCGSSSGSLPVTTGQPPLLARGLVVGGQE